MNRVFVLLIAGLANFGVVACDNGAGVTDTSPIELEGAPARVQIAGSELKLETYLWRDFMPMLVAPPDGTPLIAVLRIVTTDATRYPRGSKPRRCSSLIRGRSGPQP